VGDLEDAIREHLELKRRRGADPAEVAREEHDALSPVTRSHPVVTSPPDADELPEDPHEFDASASYAPGLSTATGAIGRIEFRMTGPADVDDATQEYRVEHDWLAEG